MEVGFETQEGLCVGSGWCAGRGTGWAFPEPQTLGASGPLGCHTAHQHVPASCSSGDCVLFRGAPPREPCFAARRHRARFHQRVQVTATLDLEAAGKAGAAAGGPRPGLPSPTDAALSLCA